MLLIFIWIGWLLVLCTYSIWTPSSFNVLIPKELPTLFEDNEFAKKKYNFQIIRLLGFFLGRRQISSSEDTVDIFNGRMSDING